MNHDNARGQMIRRRRESLDMTQDELARSVGRSKQWVSLIENGSVNVKGNSLRLVAKTLGIAESILEAAGHEAPLQSRPATVIRREQPLDKDAYAHRLTIATHAMNSIIVSSMEPSLPDPETVAVRAFEYADAMMRRGGVK